MSRRCHKCDRPLLGWEISNRPHECDPYDEMVYGGWFDPDMNKECE